MAQVAAISQQIWDMKYRLKGPDGAPVDKTIEDSWRRVAEALAEAEAPELRAEWADRFYDALSGFKYLPAGRILAGAGAKRNVTLFNCFVMGAIPDDMSGIFEHLREAALTMQQGGGIGYDFSTLRPKGAPVKGVGADASGPLSFMDVWDAMCRTIMSAGHRRGAMMATLRCDHPDIENFIEAKQQPGRLRMFNLSVLVTDAFMLAVKEDGPWELKFNGTTFRVVRARELWDKIMRSTYAAAEPGVIFIDRINRANNLQYCETIQATNPCGEQPLPPYGACLLGSINLTTLIREPFTPNAHLDLDELDRLVRVAVRMMDNVVDVSNFPLPQQTHEARSKRRIGLGVTGLADALILCEARYGSARSVELTDQWMRALTRAAYLASVEIAKEKGPFPLFERDAYLNSEFVKTLSPEVQDAIARARHPQRAGHLDRADRHHLAVRRQRLVGPGAGVQLQIHPQRPDARRQPHGGGSQRPCLPAVPPLERRRGRAAGLFRRCPDAVAAGPRADAGDGAEAHRQLDLQDHQLPGRPLVRGVQGHLHDGL